MMDDLAAVLVTIHLFFDKCEKFHTPFDLARATLLHDDLPWGNAPPYAEWIEWLHGTPGCLSDELDSIGKRGHLFNLAQLALNAAINGQGIAMGSSSLVTDELASKILRPVLPFPVRARAGYYLMVDARVADRKPVQNFTDWIVAECESFQQKRREIIEKAIQIA